MAQDRKIGSTGQVVQSPFFEMRQVRRNFTPIAHGLWSYPILQVSAKGTLRWLHLAVATEYIQEKKVTEIGGLIAMAVTNPFNTVLIEYYDYSQGEPFHPERRPSTNNKPIIYPHYGIRGLRESEMLSREELLLTGYYAAQESFCRNRSLPAVFGEGFAELLHPVFYHYIRELAPEFHKELLKWKMVVDKKREEAMKKRK